MSLCQRPRWHLFNPSNLKAAVPVAARCEGGEPIYLRPRPWDAVFTVWLACRCHYSCLWQWVRGQGGEVGEGNDDEWSEMALIAVVASSWLSEPPPPLSVPAPRHHPSGWPLRCWDRWGSWNSSVKETQTFGAIFNWLSMFKAWPLIQYWIVRV